MAQHLETDVLIIGSGIAGCTAALALADAGLGVTVVTRAKDPHESNTYYAQGGIIYRGGNDSTALLTKDVMRAGAGHCHAEAVAILAEEGPDLVKELLMEKLGVAFDRSKDGRLSLAREGGHAIPRIVHAADATGRVIQVALIRAVGAHPNIRVLQPTRPLTS